MAKWLGANWPQDTAQATGQNPNAAAPDIAFWDDQLFGDSGFALDPSNFNRSPWDVVSFGGYPMPGLCRIEPGTRIKKRLDKKPVKNRNGSTLVFLGYDEADVVVKCRIWTKSQLNALGQMMPILKPPAPPAMVTVTTKQSLPSLPSLVPGGTGSGTVTTTKTVTQGGGVAAKSVSIYHPALELLGIQAVVIESCSALYPTGTHGVWEMDIRCIEYINQTQQKGSNGGTISSTQNYGELNTAIQANPASVVPGNDPGFTGPKHSF